MRARALIVVILAAVTMVGAPVHGVASGVPAAAASSPDLTSCSVPGLQLAPELTKSPDLTSHNTPVAISPSPSRNGKYVAVLAIPGLDGVATHANDRTGAFSHLVDLSTTSAAPVASSLIGELQGIQGAAVYTFDYRAAAGRWITDSRIAPAIGSAIDCLHTLTGQKVVLVTQGSGALAARLALSQQSTTSVPRSSEVSAVEAFGAPSAGSDVAAALNGVGNTTSGERGLLDALSTYCANKTTAVERAAFCGAWPSDDLFRSIGARDLEPGTAALAALPAWPAGVAVTSLAGDVQLTVPGTGWFFAKSGDDVVDVGDLLATQDSAVEGAKTRSVALCTYELTATVSGKGVIGFDVHHPGGSGTAVPTTALDATTSPCFSGELTRSVQLTAFATATVTAQVAEELPVFHQVNAQSFESPWDDGLAFDSPSHNIHCGDEGSGEDGVNIGCWIEHYTYKDPPDVHDCEAEAAYGHGFFMVNGVPAPTCTQSELWAGEDQSVAALPYGDEIVFGGYTFICEKTGVTVINNANGHGFKVDYEAYHTF